MMISPAPKPTNERQMTDELSLLAWPATCTVRNGF
jgi:hypothetical protein